MTGIVSCPGIASCPERTARGEWGAQRRNCAGICGKGRCAARGDVSNVASQWQGDVMRAMTARSRRTVRRRAWRVDGDRSLRRPRRRPGRETSLIMLSTATRSGSKASSWLRCTRAWTPLGNAPPSSAPSRCHATPDQARKALGFSIAKYGPGNCPSARTPGPCCPGRRSRLAAMPSNARERQHTAAANAQRMRPATSPAVTSTAGFGVGEHSDDVALGNSRRVPAIWTARRGSRLRCRQGRCRRHGTGASVGVCDLDASGSSPESKSSASVGDASGRCRRSPPFRSR